MKKTPKTLKPIRPNAGVSARYRKELYALVDEMHKAVIDGLRGHYENVEDQIATDANPASFLQRFMNKVTKKWRNNFYKRADKIAETFVKSSARHTDVSFQRTLKDAGFTVEFNPTPQVKTTMEAAINENVLLIKSIADQHLSEVNQIVMRAVASGGQWGGVQEELVNRYGITKRRANLIVRDQASKANSAINKARQIETGLFDAMWMHSSGGKHPRASHVKAGRDKLVFDIRKGAYIDGEYIQPGEKINCRCVSRIVLPKRKA